jgi:rare lipoprotein A
MASLHLRRVLVGCCLAAQLLSPVQTLPLQAAEGAASTTQGPVASPADETQGTEGVAAYYAKRYNGRRTNSGHRYDPTKLTAAHPTLPYGTRVRVVNLANDKEVVVTINDRCRSRKEPFIDLSRAAARELGFLGKGTARVRIIPLAGDAG